jgi:hypothetical protein
MTPKETALDTINDTLHINAKITVKFNEVKCTVPDPDEGGTMKAYLTAEECEDLAQAFSNLAVELRTHNRG